MRRRALHATTMRQKAHAQRAFFVAAPFLLLLANAASSSSAKRRASAFFAAASDRSSPFDALFACAFDFLPSPAAAHSASFSASAFAPAFS